MAAIVETFDQERGIVQVPRPAPPVEPEAVDPSAAAPPEAETPSEEQPDAGGPPAETGTGEPPPEDESEENAVATEGRTPRPFVSRLIRENERYKSQTAALEAHNAYLMQQLQQRAAVETPQAPTSLPPSLSPQPVGPPRIEDYGGPEGDTAKFWSDLARWNAEQVVEEKQQALQRQQVEMSRQAVLRTFDQRMQEGLETYHDVFYNALQTIRLRVPPTYYPDIEQVATHEKGAAFLLHLGQHPELIADLDDYNDKGRLRKLERVLEEVVARQEKPPPPPPPPPARAPTPAQPSPHQTLPPVRPLSGNGSVPPPGVSPREIAEQGGGVKAYRAARRAQR